MATTEPGPFSNVKRVHETDRQVEANLLLDNGWLLLSVGQDPYGVPRYVLGSDSPDADADLLVGKYLTRTGGQF